MPDEERRPTEREMEDLLREVGSRADYPPTPDAARAVRQRLESDPDSDGLRPPPDRRWFRSPAMRWAAAVVLVAALGLPTLFIATRGGDFSLFWAGAGGSSAGVSGDEAASSGMSEEGEALPDSAAGPSGAAMSGKLGGGLGLEGRVSLKKARELATFPVLLRGLGGPDEVYVVDRDEVVLVYRASSALPEMGDTGVGAVISERRGNLASSYLDEGTENYQRVMVEGGSGYWFPEGSEPKPQVGTIGRLPGGALLWERDGATLLLRSDLKKDDATRLAGTARQVGRRD